MRTIKLRAWDASNKIMHYDFQFIASGNEGNDWIVFTSECAYCGKWFEPKYSAVTSRINATNIINQREGRLYCSDDCKQECPTFKKNAISKRVQKCYVERSNSYASSNSFKS